MTSHGIKFENGEYGRRATIVAPWSADMASVLVKERIAELELNDGKGWHGKDLEFLVELPWLQSLKIIDYTLSSVEPIHSLHELATLEVMTYCTTELRFSAFPRLINCGLEWRHKASSLFGCTTLERLFVNSYDGSSTDSFGRLINLESLAILNAPIKDLRGLRPLQKLYSLRLGNVRELTSLAGIEHLTNLQELEIHTCPHIRSIDEIGHLTRLRKLHLNNDGDIESLRPIAKLLGLEWLLFYESTNILDGDLSPLLNLKNLSRVAFQNRKHYSHRREELGIAQRG